MSRQHNPSPGTSSIISISEFPTEEQPHNQEHSAKPSKLVLPVAIALIFILLIYGFLLYQGLPQQWTEMSNADHYADHHAEEHADHDAEKEEHPPYPSYFMVAPFVILLLCIAILPLIPSAARWWEHNTNKLLVAGSLGMLTLLYYLFGGVPVEQHLIEHKMVTPADGGFAIAKTVFMNAIVVEFLPFIVLLFALFTITGGIRICSSLKATPGINAGILLIGSILASFIGTTGAAMLLIRPLLDMNRGRKYKAHTVIFFIFCVCNCGGCLTPLGDPPLFLGYLRGVPFEWTFFALIREWAFVNLTLIALYFLWDALWYYRREAKEYRTQGNDSTQKLLTVSGWILNVPLLLGVVAAVALLDPSRTVPGTDWHPWYYLREAVQLGLVAISLLCGSLLIRKENVFNFLAIGEVAALFFGIFLCMQVPLQILNVYGKNIVEQAEHATGLPKTKLFFWSTGALSSVLDNAPTYVVFFETAKGLSPETDEEKTEWLELEGREFRPVQLGGRGGVIDYYLLIAVSIGAVFMGAMTYIGNGPNFLIKAVAEQDGVNMPSFFGYMVYSCFILLPLLVVMTLVFL